MTRFVQTLDGDEHVSKVEGIVIRTTDYGETNKIVTIFSRELGKVSAMARGQKPKSRLASVSQLMTHGHFLIQMGSGLGTLQQGEIISTMKEIREDIFLTAYASFIVELTDKATEDKNIIRIYLKCYIKRCIICVRVLIQKYYH